MDNDIWIKSLIRNIKLTCIDKIVISDIRFINEYNMLKDNFEIKSLRVTRPCNEYSLVNYHPSEDISDIPFDYTLENDSGIKDLYIKISSILK